MTAWIATDGFLRPGSRRYILISQDRHEVYITIAYYDQDWLDYLQGATDINSPRSFLRLNCYGPWNIFKKQHVFHLSKIILAFTVQVSSEIHLP